MGVVCVSVLRVWLSVSCKTSCKSLKNHFTPKSTGKAASIRQTRLQCFYACGKKTIQLQFVLLLTSPLCPLLILTLSLSFFLFFFYYYYFSSFLPFGPGVSSFGLPPSSWLPASFSACVCASDAPCGQMTAGRCHTLLSPVTEESGEEGTNSEVSSPPACRSPSPGPNADTPANQVLESRPHPLSARFGFSKCRCTGRHSHRVKPVSELQVFLESQSKYSLVHTARENLIFSPFILQLESEER